MDEAEQEARVAATERHLKSLRDAIPEGPGLLLSERESIAVALVVERCAQCELEDIMGAIMKTSGGTVLDGDEIVDLSKRLDVVLARAKQRPLQR